MVTRVMHDILIKLIHSNFLSVSRHIMYIPRENHLNETFTCNKKQMVGEISKHASSALALIVEVKISKFRELP